MTRRLLLSFVLSSLLACATLAAQEAEVVTAPVQLDGVVLFHVRGASSLPAARRARLIELRLAGVAADPRIPVEAIDITTTEGFNVIVAGNVTLMAVTDADAALEQLQPLALAHLHQSRMRQAVADYRAARTPAALRRHATYAALATLAFVIALAVVLLSRRWINSAMARRFEPRIHSVGIQSLELMRAERIWSALRTAVLVCQVLVVITMTIAYTGFVLALFPWTRGWARGLYAVVLTPLQIVGAGIVASIPGLVFVACVFVLVRLSLRVVRLIFEAVEHGRVTFGSFDPEWAQPTYKIVRVAIVAFGLVVAYPYIPGSESDAFRGVSIFLGIVFSLGSSSAISNIIAGYMMTYRRAFKVGDRIKVGATTGDVVEMRLQVTHLRSIKNEEIIMPNSQILGAEVLNYSSLSRAHGLILHTQVTIGYDTPWRQVEALLIMSAARTPGLLPDPPPFVLVPALGDFAVTYELNVFCGNAQAMQGLYAELHRHILDVFNEYGVQIMSPAYVADPKQPKVVPHESWYAAPALGPDDH